MTKYEIFKSTNTVELLKEAGLTTAQVLRNLDADKFLNDNKRNSAVVRWFCKNVLLFNNFGKPIIKGGGKCLSILKNYRPTCKRN